MKIITTLNKKNYLNLTIYITTIISLLNACNSDNKSDTQPISNIKNMTTVKINKNQNEIKHSNLTVEAKLGKQIFNDVSLSKSGKMSCATCHDSNNTHSQNNNLSVQFGGKNQDITGFRAVPSLRYLSFNHPLTVDKTGKVTGGFNLDGKVDSLAEQAKIPFLAAHEMANDNIDDLISRFKNTTYINEFIKVFGTHIINNNHLIFDKISFSLSEFQKQDPEFHLFNSKYDLYLQGKLNLNSNELRGLKLFNDKEKGNCMACHTSKQNSNGLPPLFTDFSFDNLGLPRNKNIPATKKSTYFDLGLCAIDRPHLKEKDNLCGAFKVPSLRNVATKHVFFHNGIFNNLTDVVKFYARRDTHPEEWYPIDAQGNIHKFNDIPKKYHSNINTIEAPYDRKKGNIPRLSDTEIQDIVSFLGTLTDNYHNTHLNKK